MTRISAIQGNRGRSEQGCVGHGYLVAAVRFRSVHLGVGEHDDIGSREDGYAGDRGDPQAGRDVVVTGEASWGIFAPA
jgi:hypothetical protein